METKFSQRELKTINLKDLSITGQYIKFEIYQNHNNKKNIFNQVAIDAINIMGEPKKDKAVDLAERYLKKVERENIDPNGRVSKGRTPSIPSNSPTGDAETQDVLRRLLDEKKHAEEKEDFDLASALKETIYACTTLSDQIWQCDTEKRKMVQEERYEEAKGLKIRRDELKLRRDRVINENLYQYGLSAEYFVNEGSTKSTVSSSKYSNEDNGYLEVSPKASYPDENDKRFS